MNSSGILQNHEALQERRRASDSHLKQLRALFSDEGEIFKDKAITIFCAGSIGRGEIGKFSDIDPFVISGDTNLVANENNKKEILDHIISMINKYGFPEFTYSDYYKVYSVHEMLEALGKPRDDSENLFTARMLLILESKPICNEHVYEEYLDNVISHYFRDNKGKKIFRPLFLLNDLLRYWRTLCLNYEGIRDDPSRDWRKKNINLKFSRKLTVFGTVLPIIAGPMTSHEDVSALTRLSPSERFSYGLDLLNDKKLLCEYNGFLDNYEEFLSVKERIQGDPKNNHGRDLSFIKIEREFSNFIYNSLSHQSIPHEFRKFLIT